MIGVDLGHRGYDLFIEKPNSGRTFFCNICGKKTVVEKSIPYPSSFADAFSKKLDLHDVYKCPHINEKWHDNAFELVQAIEKTPSKRIAELMKQDLYDILKENRK